MKKAFWFRLSFCLIILATITYEQIYRILNIPITWDEGITYVFYVNRFFHSGDFLGGIRACLNGEIYCAANNHLQNTFLIGIAELITHTRYNSVVIRFPIFIFYIFYIYSCSRQFMKKNISYVAFVMLICCSYINEFFALARGYGYAVAMIGISLFAYKEWLEDGKNRHIIWAFYGLLIAELANTAALLITAAVAMVFLIKIVSGKKFLYYWKKLWFPASVWILIQLAVVKYHFLVTKYDLSIANDREGGLKTLIVNLISIPLTQRMVPKPLQLFLACLVILNVYVLIRKRKVINDYPFSMMIFSYVFICFSMVESLKHFSDQSGYPTGRVLILVYPLCVLALDELLRNGLSLLNEGTLQKMIPATSLAVALIGLVFFSATTNYKQTTDWPEAAICKKAAYKVYKSHGKKGMGYLKDISYNTDAFIYWQQKILYEDGYDIFNPGSKN
ncbi:hypothetical protein [Butyrivibrio sp. JL13D10]|uniref:hypothetical protein n=1 Tax=Butyrivibrio sp. JL13D10 TaxID=3236815 RepID=UPI0038B4BEDB